MLLLGRTRLNPLPVAFFLRQKVRFSSMRRVADSGEGRASSGAPFLSDKGKGGNFCLSGFRLFRGENPRLNANRLASSGLAIHSTVALLRALESVNAVSARSASPLKAL